MGSGRGDNGRMPELSTHTASLRRPWWQRPSVISAAVVVALLGAALAWPLLRLSVAPPTLQPEPQDLPWLVRVHEGGGSLVFGLRPGDSTLADVEARFGDNLRVGLIAPNGQPPALEGFVETFQAGFVTGRLVLAFDADPAWLLAAQARAPRNEVGEGGRSRRYGLAQSDLSEARRSPLVGLTFLPAARLDEPTLVLRFGEPAERLRGPGGEQQLLYPALGVAIALPPAEGEAAKAKALIQYVAPRDFERRLRAPLRQALPAAAAASAALAR